MFDDQGLDGLLAVIDTLLSDSDRFQQRSCFELLAGVLRGRANNLTFQPGHDGIDLRIETLAKTAG